MNKSLLICALLLALVVADTAVPYCVQYDSNVCIQCRGGWYLGDDGLCHAQCLESPKTTAQCSIYNVYGNCTKCNFGFSLSGNECVSTYLRAAATCTVKYCVTCPIETECDQCRGGYFLSNNTCIPQCFITSTKNTSLCTACHFGFALNSASRCEETNFVSAVVQQLTQIFE